MSEHARGVAVPARLGPEPGRARRPRALFYSHDGYGLGHIRITLALASASATKVPDASLLILTGSMHAHAYDLPPNIDYVKLPAVAKRLLYRDLPVPAQRGALTDVWHLRQSLIHATANAFAPDLLVVDHAPAGLNGELLHTLASLRGAEPAVALVLCLRDITYGAELTRRSWAKHGVLDLLDRTYDRILVYGDRGLFDPIAEYGFSATTAAKTTFCGYIKREDPLLPAATVREALNATSAPLVVVAPGGGADGRCLIETYLAAVRDERLADVVSFVVTGPLLDATDRADLEAIAAGLPRVTMVPFTPDLVSYLNAADAVVTMGGYNAVAEVVSLGKRAVVVPRAEGSDEQTIRAERFARRGLVNLLDPDVLTAHTLADAVSAALAASAPAAHQLDFTGVPRISELLAQLLRQHAR